MKKGVDYPGIAVTFLCHDGAGRYVFGLRGKKCRDEHGVWDCGGGGVDFGERIENAVRREVLEEYGAEPLEIEFLGFRDVHREHGDGRSHWIAFDHKVRINPDRVKNMEPHKIDRIDWFTLDNLPKSLHSQLPFALRKYEGRL